MVASTPSRGGDATPAVGPSPGGTGRGAAIRKLSFAALGTTCEVQYVADSAAHALEFERVATAWVRRFEERYSRFKPASIVSRINDAAGRAWVEVDAEAESLLNLCDMLHGLTRGVLDPTALPLIRLWNYKAENPRVPAETEIAAARALVGWRKVERAPGRVFLPVPGMALDFGGFGKEYAVDIVAQLAVERGIRSALVDFGHDLRAVGTPPGRAGWHIGLEDPARPGATSGSIGVADRGVASSGDYLRCFRSGGKRYGHIIDPRTGWPVANGCVQATVVAPTCLHAGVLSTTAFVLGVPSGIQFIQSFPGAEGLLVTDGMRAQTRGFYHYVAT